MAALRLSTQPGMGMEMRASATAIKSAERPAPSLPIIRAQGFVSSAADKGSAFGFAGSSATAA